MAELEFTIQFDFKANNLSTISQKETSLIKSEKDKVKIVKWSFNYIKTKNRAWEAKTTLEIKSNSNSTGLEIRRPGF